MSSYSELIKSFERIRAYMREFYVYGFKSRDGYTRKSARSYDDERRRIESWLGEHMRFVRTPEGKTIFISVDSRRIRHNPFYHAWKAKSFTDGDITLHFILFDILYTPSVRLTLSELLRRIDEDYLSAFPAPRMPDESTVRKKLKEYCEAGIIETERVGRSVYYRRAETVDISGLTDALHFFSEVAPCGVVGSFILDKTEEDTDLFAFKHHYITGAMDSGVLAALFLAMREKRAVTVTNVSRRRDTPKTVRLIPLRVLISVQSGRQHLLAYTPEYRSFDTYRIDHLSDVKLGEPSSELEGLRSALDGMRNKMWGVGLKRRLVADDRPEHVDFTVRVGDGEEFIVKRLEREKRVGRVERLDAHTYRFTADVYDAGEMLPWIRSFICRITALHFSSKVLEEQFRSDLSAMYRMYGIEEADDDIQ